MEKFIAILKNSLSADTFVKLTLSKTRYRTDLQNVYVRMIELKKEQNLSFTYHHETKDEVQNFSISEGVERIQLHLLEDFKSANLLLINKNIALEISKKGKTRMMEKATTNEKPDKMHNKAKSRFVTADRPYLHHLGITSKEGKVLKNWQSKYKQIDKYIEIIDGLLTQTALPKTIHIVDMGSGKGYLTFALYDYLVNVLDLDVTLTGIELREHLVDFCNDIAKQSNFEKLNFIAQDINDYPAEKIDILIALHACDIATDIALAKGMLSEAALIVAAPCCHKQVRKQMAKQNPLQAVLKHGILEERQAEMITDGIRALMLEGNGYAAKVFEFVSSEHTNKNLMIVGTKTQKPALSAFEEIAQIKAHFGIEEHYLEKLMK
jgi:SAM-dependent methyltransferase